MNERTQAIKTMKKAAEEQAIMNKAIEGIAAVAQKNEGLDLRLLAVARKSCSRTRRQEEEKVIRG